jgi:hypothetical protein
LHLLWLLAAALGAQTLTDDFSRYPAGGDPAPAWDSDGFTVRDGALRGDDGWSVWRAVPFAAEGACAVDLAATRPVGNTSDWLTAGLALYHDARNYWALNLVVAPEKDGVRRRFLEFQEMLGGVWLAQSAPATRLPQTVHRGDGTQWVDGRAYRLELSWNAETITGRVLDGGVEVASFGHRFAPGVKAVTTGRPAVRVNGLPVVCRAASARVERSAPEPDRPRPPAWASRPGATMARGTGYFATAREGDRWWLVDPEGKPFYDIGTDHITYRGHPCEKLGYPPFSRTTAARYGSEEAWARTATDRLKSWNFNVVAAGHAPSVRHRGLAHILFASFGSGFARREWICEPIHWTGFPNVFSPDWPRYCRVVARRMAAESRDDPWCLGTFLDNELEWYGKRGQLVDEVFGRGADHTAKRALLDWLKQRYGGLAGLNAALGTRFGDETAFLAGTTVPQGPKLAEVRSEFLKVIAERYFSVACAALRAADPQHLVLGCRFAGQAPEEIIPLAGRYNDVFTINIYPWIDLGTGKVRDAAARLARYYQLAGKPMIITEWSFPALDAGLPCRHGAGMRVDTQAQKARCYQLFAELLADLPFMVGYHYFEYLDEPAEGISSTFPEDSNYGLVNIKDEPYPELTALATTVNAAAAERHARSTMPGPEPAGARVFPAAGKPVVLRNSGPAPVADVPCVLDDAPAQLVRLVTLAPGATVARLADAPLLKPVETVRASGGGAVWQCTRRNGSLFDAVSADGLALGQVTVAAHQIVAGRHNWVETNKVVSLTSAESPAGTLIEAVLEHQSAGPETAAFRVGVRAAVPGDRPVALVRPLWYESLDDRPWVLEDAFVFCRPAIGGSDADDVLGGPAVPAYYLRAGAWTDAKLGGAFGAFSPSADWDVTFWVDTGRHPDARFHVAAELSKGARWESPLRPYLWLFALKEAGAWRTVTARHMGAAQLGWVAR